MRALPFFVAAIVACAAASAHATDVMVIGSYHMANPGHDLHNLAADDVLAPKRQKELADAVNALAKFKPTLVAVEASTDGGAAVKVAKYHDYLDGKLDSSRNEIIQIGFRLAKSSKLTEVYGIDIDVDFPYEAVKNFAENGAHPQLATRLQQMNANTDASLKALDAVLKRGTISDALRFINEPKQIADDNAFYRELLRFGAGAEQPGVAVLNAWQSRNNGICARLVQLASADDRVVVLYGAGHAYLLRDCVRETPGYKLVDVADYLPK